MPLTAQPALPQFEVRLEAPDISDWVPGNTGIPGFTTRASEHAGPHVGLLAITHGNEIAGAIVLDRLLRAGIAPCRGKLTFGFVNLAAFERFDPRKPTLSRFVDEDINRIWESESLDGPRHSVELERARQIRPIIDTFDVMLDIHSMLWPSNPLMLCGTTTKGHRLALGIAIPELVVADRGHVSGRRIIDYERFSDVATPYVANLLEAGQHWQPDAVQTAHAAVVRLLRYLNMVHEGALLPDMPLAVPQRVAEVTTVVTAATGGFVFVQRWHGGEVIAQRDTLLALDGTREVRTPYDNCLLVMPSLRPSRGHTAVRLARFITLS